VPNPILNKDQLAKANELLERVRQELQTLAGDDPNLMFAYRRKVAKMLVYDERSGPNERRKLKSAKRLEQNGLCAACAKPLPPSYNVLDRMTAIAGYTTANTRLICESCDRATQVERGYK
jgi:RNase P subunit RPR2